MRLVTAHRELGQWQSCAKTAKRALTLLEEQITDTRSASLLYKRQKSALESALGLARTNLDTARAPNETAKPDLTEEPSGAQTKEGDMENKARASCGAKGAVASAPAPKMVAGSLQSQLRNLAALMERNR